MPYHVLIDTQLNAELMAMIGDDCVLHLWQGEATDPALLQQIEGYFTYGHPKVDGAVMDKMPKLRIISNFGVGVDRQYTESGRWRHGRHGLCPAHRRGTQFGDWRPLCPQP